MVETQLFKLRGTSDTLLGRAILYFIYNIVFVNLTYYMLASIWLFILSFTNFKEGRSRVFFV